MKRGEFGFEEITYLLLFGKLPDEKQLKEYNERIEKEMAEKKAAYQSGQAYRNGSDDVIDVNYVEKDENE